MQFHRWIFVVAVLLGLPCPAWAAPAADQWVAVVAPGLRDAVRPLCDLRARQGYQVVIVDAADVLIPGQLATGEGGPLRDKVHQLCRKHPGPTFVLLVGDPRAGPHIVPALTGVHASMKGQPTDLGYGRLDDERYPTVAVGRLPARSVEQARDMVDKTIEWETDRSPGEWRTRLTLLAGNPRFNPLAGAVIEQLVLSQLRRLGPTWTIRALYDNAASPFYAPPAELNRRARQYLAEGQAFILYIGHSLPSGIWGNRVPYLPRGDWANVAIRPRGGVLITFGCFGCQLAGPDGQGYGVAAVRNRHGPVAVIGAHGKCFPYPMLLQADGLLDFPVAKQPPARLGELWLAMQESLGTSPLNPITFKLLNSIDGDPSLTPEEQRLEHLEMFVLLGDPALQLAAVPQDIKLETPEVCIPGGELRVRGRLPERLNEADVRVTVLRPLTSPYQPATRPANPARGEATEDHFVLAEQRKRSRDGRFEAAMMLPDGLPWDHVIVRVYASSMSQEGMAAKSVPLRR